MRSPRSSVEKELKENIKGVRSILRVPRLNYRDVKVEGATMEVKG